MNERPTEFLEVDEVRRLPVHARSPYASRTARRCAAHARRGWLARGRTMLLLAGDLKTIQGREVLHFTSLKKRSGRHMLRIVPVTVEATADIRRYWAAEYKAESPADELPSSARSASVARTTEGRSRRRLSTSSYRAPFAQLESQSASRRIRSGILARHRYCDQALTSRPCERFSATRASPDCHIPSLVT